MWTRGHVRIDLLVKTAVKLVIFTHIDPSIVEGANALTTTRETKRINSPDSSSPVFRSWDIVKLSNKYNF